MSCCPSYSCSPSFSCTPLYYTNMISCCPTPSCTPTCSCSCQESYQSCDVSKLADFCHYGGQQKSRCESDPCCKPPPCKPRLCCKPPPCKPKPRPCCPPPCKPKPRPCCPPPCCKPDPCCCQCDPCCCCECDPCCCKPDCCCPPKAKKCCIPTPPCAPTCITDKCKDLPAHRLRNVDVLEELCYFVPGGCDEDREMDCYAIDCCGNIEKLGGECCTTCPENCCPRPVKYSRRQRFTFNDAYNGAPSQFDPWPFTDNCGGGCGSKGKGGRGRGCGGGAGDGCGGGGGAPKHNPCLGGRQYTYRPQSPIDISDMLPPDSGVYYFDRVRRVFVPEKDLPKPPEIIEKQIKVPEVEEYEILEEEGGGGGGRGNRSDICREEEPCQQPIIQPVVQPIIMPQNPCGPPACNSPCNPCMPPCNPCMPPCNPCMPPCNPCMPPCNPCMPSCNPCNPCNPCMPSCNPCNPFCGQCLPMVIPMCPQGPAGGGGGGGFNGFGGGGSGGMPMPPFPFPPPPKKKKKKKSHKSSSDPTSSSGTKSGTTYSGATTDNFVVPGAPEDIAMQYGQYDESEFPENAYTATVQEDMTFQDPNASQYAADPYYDPNSNVPPKRA